MESGADCKQFPVASASQRETLTKKMGKCFLQNETAHETSVQRHRPVSPRRTLDDYDDHLQEECGVMACVLASDTPMSVINVASTVYLGLVALQHRGQEGAGIVTSDGKGCQSFKYHRGQGLVNSVFSEESLKKLTGTIGIGHTRYGTRGGGDLVNIQPFVVHTRHGPIAVAHNGQLINASELRSTVLERGVGLSTNSDSELITQMLSLTPPRGEKNGPNWPARIRHLVEATPTAYSLALMFEDKIYGARDPFGNRPLCIGKLLPLPDTGNEGDKIPANKVLGWIICSESCVFHAVGAVFYKEVLPGEIVEISSTGVRTLDIIHRPKKSRLQNNQIHIDSDDSLLNDIEESPPAFCIFEYVYFARPDSIFEGQQVYSVRKQCGIQLAKEAAVEADVVSSIPETATPAALGYAMQTGLPYTEVFCKNRYSGRSFILPDTRSRQRAVANKFGPVSDNIMDKRVVLVDDSIVRGNTVASIIRMIRRAGAREVHIRIASPPIKYPCYMGIDIPTMNELIANKKEPEKLAEAVGADSLVYLSIDGLVKAVQERIIANSSHRQAIGHCTACLDGKYPYPVDW